MAVSGLRLQWQLWKCNGMEESGKLHIELVHLHCCGNHGDGGASLLDWVILNVFSNLRDSVIPFRLILG